MGDRPAIPPARTPVRLRDLHAQLRTEKWFAVFAANIGDAIKTAAMAGMPSNLGEEIYKEALKTAIPHAVAVLGSDGNRFYSGLETR